MKPITRFNQPSVLSEIGRYLLPEFFDRFKNELATMNVSIPDPGLADGPYYDTVAELFNSAALPPALLEAVLAVEELADPANKARLEQAFWESPYELYLEPQASPEHTALRLWLHAPFTSSEGADDSTPFSSPEVVCPVGEEATAAPRSSVPPEPFREPSVPPLPKSEPSKRPILSPPVKSPTGHTRKGKVARLPLAVRDRLNVMLQDGVPYAQAIKALGADAAELTVDHITSWKTEGGYQDWVNEQKDIEDMHLHEEYTLQLVKENGGTTLNEATIKTATAQIRKAIRAYGEKLLQKALDDNSDNYMRLLNALARLTTGAIHCQHHRAKDEERKANQEKANVDPASLSVTPETLRKIEELLRLR